MNPPEDFYQILNVPPESGRFQIKRAYRQLALLWHPSRVPIEKQEEAEKMFKKILEAYFVLGNRESRKMYDQQRAVEGSVFQSGAWDFVDQSSKPYNPNSFNVFYREQLVDSDAFELDWREVWGGTIAKFWAGILFFVFFIVGQDVLPLLSIDLFGTQLCLPVVAATLYIVLGSLRDFIWEHIAEDEVYDISVLGACWFFLIGLTVLAVAKPWITPNVPSSDSAVGQVEQSKTSYQKIPVNLEVFRLNPALIDKAPRKGMNDI